MNGRGLYCLNKSTIMIHKSTSQNNVTKVQYSQSTILVSSHSLQEPVSLNNQRSLLVSNHSLQEPVGMNNQRSLLVSNHSLQERVGMNNQRSLLVSNHSLQEPVGLNNQRPLLVVKLITQRSHSNTANLTENKWFNMVTKSTWL